MLGRIVEVSSDQRHLSMHRGFLIVKTSSAGFQNEELGRVPLDDIAALIANAHGLSYTNNLLVALAERGIPLVLCSSNHNVVGLLWPIEGHHQQAHRIEAQIACGAPLRKRLWACLVKTKILHQSLVLKTSDAPNMPLVKLSHQVRSGDPDNIEAQAARKYWNLLFGPSFRRDHSAKDINSFLNYGYTVLRAATARSVVAAGLHPSIGLHHSNDNNAMRLVDDLMEPFRPVVDQAVWRLHKQGHVDLDQESKRSLVRSLYWDITFKSGRSPVIVVIQRLATSLAQVLTAERKTLELSAGLSFTPGERED